MIDEYVALVGAQSAALTEPTAQRAVDLVSAADLIQGYDHCELATGNAAGPWMTVEKESGP